MTVVRVFANDETLGAALADEIGTGIERAREDGRWYLLGCPGGRTPRSTYQALAERMRGADLTHLVIVMMDDYIVPTADGGFEHCPASAHYSCRRFALEEIVAPLNATAATGVTDDHVWLPDPAVPGAYRRRIDEAGGVDLFIVASGASDGHVAFVQPGMPLDGDVSIIRLAELTRQDNMATFPDFAALEEVPTHGVSVGLGTICDLSRAVRQILNGADKRESARRVLGTEDFDPDWPATFIHRCRDGQILLDEAARPGGP